MVEPTNLNPPSAQILAHRIGLRGRRGKVLQVADPVIDRISADKLPGVRVKGAEPLLDPQEGPGILDGGPDFQAVADDAGVLEQPTEIPRSVSRDRLGIGSAERFVVAGPLVEHRLPGQPCLRGLQREELEEHAVVMHRYASLGIVIRHHKGIASAPCAPDSRRCPRAPRRGGSSSYRYRRHRNGRPTSGSSHPATARA